MYGHTFVTRFFLFYCRFIGLPGLPAVLFSPPTLPVRRVFFSRDRDGASDDDVREKRRRRRRVRVVHDGVHRLRVPFDRLRRARLGAAGRAVAAVAGLRRAPFARGRVRPRLVREDIRRRDAGGAQNVVQRYVWCFS